MITTKIKAEMEDRKSKSKQTYMEYVNEILTIAKTKK